VTATRAFRATGKESAFAAGAQGLANLNQRFG
jgi:hypothetical protein